MTATYITTTLPYVNARPHVGHALELVQADVLARHHRGRGDAVRFQAGTDDNSLKNVLAAEAAGVGVREFVDRNAEAFLALGGALSLTVDDFIRTSRDPRHRPGVERFWRACSGSQDYQRWWTGPDAASTWPAKACSASTPSTGRPCCCPPVSRYRPTSSCTTTSPPRPQAWLPRLAIVAGHPGTPICACSALAKRPDHGHPACHSGTAGTA